jgi:hypothetical protein
VCSVDHVVPLVACARRAAVSVTRSHRTVPLTHMLAAALASLPCVPRHPQLQHNGKSASHDGVCVCVCPPPQVWSDRQYASIISRSKKQLDLHMRTKMELRAVLSTLGTQDAQKTELVGALKARDRWLECCRALTATC